MAILEIKRVSKFFGGLAANSDVSFEMEQGMIMGLIGPNGAGKTTLFNCITGYYPPSRGEIIFNGRRMNGLHPGRRMQTRHGPHLAKGAAARQDDAWWTMSWSAPCAAPIRSKRRVSWRWSRSRLFISNSRMDFRAGSLPIGERKKLEVARVLATQPKLLLLDEVMGGLNPTESEEIIQLILDIKKLGITQMVIEHDMKAIMRISDRIVVLNSGEKLAEGSPAGDRFEQGRR